MSETNFEEKRQSDTQPIRPAARPGETRASQVVPGSTTQPMGSTTGPAHIEPPVDNQLNAPTPIPVNAPPKPAPIQTAPAQQPASAAHQTARPAANKPPRKRRSWILYSVLGLLALVLIAGLSATGGYFSGIGLRQNAEKTQVAAAAQEQYERAMEDIDDGAYGLARQRLEYVIKINPSYPGAVDKLADVILQLNTTATPTLAPTPTLTPTPDLRGVQEVYSLAEQSLLNSEWQKAIEALNSLRSTDPNYRPVDVDGMFYIAFRNLGRDKILKESDLETGMYNLSLAERFGLLDAEAQSLFSWSSLYVKGASFWELDWAQATSYFSQVAPYAPNLSDGSGMTATQRYVFAGRKYAAQLMNQKQWCDAKTLLESILALSQDAETQQIYTEASMRCSGVDPNQPTPAPGGGQP